ncbi:MAG: class I SAM-dependent methyltransferase [Elusimicrobia bacterium]|nr:class I SAM-dependent methyltransferase [Elusimicrobiota bacterium]
MEGLNTVRLIASAILQKIYPQRLERTPEPTALTAHEGAVANYDRVLFTKMALLYSAILEFIHRTRPQKSGGDALDIACGPGHLTLALARFMNYSRVTGVDLSEPMIRTAAANAARLGLGDRVSFQSEDATRLDSFPDHRFQLTTFTDASHHLRDLDSVSRVLAAMDRVTRPDGLVLVVDIIRLKTRRITDLYVESLGYDYVRQGLNYFLEDFKNSMEAAWTMDEFRKTVPQKTERRWVHWTPRFVPSMQCLLGLPADRTRLFVRPFWKTNPFTDYLTPLWKERLGPSWTRQTLLEERLNRWTLKTGKTDWVR